MSSVARIISKESRKEGIQEKGFFAPARDYAAFSYQARFPLTSVLSLGERKSFIPLSGGSPFSDSIQCPGH
jgi:hypothetical protein